MRNVAVLSLIAIPAAWGLYRLAAGGSAPLVETRRVSISAAQRDIGQPLETAEFPWTLRVTNNSGKEIEIVKFSTSCNCVRVLPAKVTIPPHDFVDLHLRLNLLGRDLTKSESVRHFSAEIQPEIAGHPSQEPWTIRGEVQRIWWFDQAPIDFRTSEGLGGHVAARDVGVTTFIPLSRVESTADVCDVAVTRAPMNDRRFCLRVTPKRSLPTGPFQGILRTVAIGVDGTKLAEVKLPIEGSVRGPVTANPSNLVFGSRSVGQALVETLLFRFGEGEPVVIENLASDLEGFAWEPIGSAQPGCAAFKVSFRVAAAGPRAGSVRATIVSKGESRSVIAVPVYYLGVVP